MSGTLNTASRADALAGSLDPYALESFDARTLDLIRRRRDTSSPLSRGWLVRRALLAADVVGLVLAFGIAQFVMGAQGDGGYLPAGAEIALFLLTLPAWIVMAKLGGLYDMDEERADHSTVDEFARVFYLVTVGAWFLLAGAWVTGVVQPDIGKVIGFWLLAIALVTGGRALARSRCRRSTAYWQNTIIVGAGQIGQLVARKLVKHPEYGLNVVGFVDSAPRAQRADLDELTVLGTPLDLPKIVETLGVERIVIAFSNEPDEATMATVRSLRDADIQIDVVPRLFELVGPRATMHTVESLPLVGLPPANLSPSSRLVKRGLDLVLATLALLVTAPLFAYIAIRIKRDSPGPVFFRQTRLGIDMREFTALKFRTMYTDTDDSLHREYIRSTMDSRATLGSNGLYKLDRAESVTPFGSWLRRTSLDELPQLINVVRGDMSLVGPRPCIPYETESFAPHHFDRFLVPQGMTGLWQVTARANSSFGEALEMDVAYVHGWSFGLDLRLLCRTPWQLGRQVRATT
jgi:exopolysaccharide biosynthesis polyprenyl glycosylphosphotransferase